LSLKINLYFSNDYLQANITNFNFAYRTFKGHI